MDCHQAYYLALLQGLTEFLPVSADSHLILMRLMSGWSEPNPAYSLATRIGTLAAAVIYFSSTLRAIAKGLWRSLSGQDGGRDARLAWYLLLGSLPAGLAGLGAAGAPMALPHSPLALAASTVVFGLALGLAFKLGSERRSQTELDWKDALIVGLCQAVALFPGASRTALTLTGGLSRGLDRHTAARFSILLSIPVSAVMALAESYDLIRSPVPIASWSFFLGALLSGTVALVAIDGFLKLLGRIGLLPFVVYRLVLGTVLFFVFL